MKRLAIPAPTHQTFVVTAIFITQKTVTAGSVSAALDLAHETLVEDGATKKDLCNWHAHPVEKE